MSFSQKIVEHSGSIYIWLHSIHGIKTWSTRTKKEGSRGTVDRVLKLQTTILVGLFWAQEDL